MRQWLSRTPRWYRRTLAVWAVFMIPAWIVLLASLAGDSAPVAATAASPGEGTSQIGFLLRLAGLLAMFAPLVLAPLAARRMRANDAESDV